MTFKAAIEVLVKKGYKADDNFSDTNKYKKPTLLIQGLISIYILGLSKLPKLPKFFLVGMDNIEEAVNGFDRTAKKGSFLSLINIVVFYDE